MTEKIKHTERSVLDALRRRHNPKERGNGPEWAFVEHVRNAAGFNANRTIDAMGLSLWPSRGMELHGYEVKTSRADFRREIADPAKMDAFAHVLDRFWIVAPKGIVPVAELPSSWGLLEVMDDGTAIRQKVAAPLLTEQRASIPRTMLVPLLRASGATVGGESKEISEAHKRGFEKGLKSMQQSYRDHKKMYEDLMAEHRLYLDMVAEIDEALGSKLYRRAIGKDDAEKARTLEAIRLVLNGADVDTLVRRGVERALSQMTYAAHSIQNAKDQIEAATGVKLS